MTYVEIPTFIKDEDRSAWEGETMHCVGRLARGDYNIFLAIDLMARLVDQFLKNAEAAGLEREEVQKQLQDAILIVGKGLS